MIIKVSMKKKLILLNIFILLIGCQLQEPSKVHGILYLENRIKQLKVLEPPKREKGIMVANVEELVQKLKHEAKVI